VGAPGGGALSPADGSEGAGRPGFVEGAFVMLVPPPEEVGAVGAVGALGELGATFGDPEAD